MHRELLMAGAWLEAVFYSPLTPDEGCTCRMPALGLQQIAEWYGVEPAKI
jgi:Histidinol phosphatase and related phosphatases